MDAKMIQKLKEKGVAPDVILDLILEDIPDQATPEQVPTGPTEPAENKEEPAPAPAAPEPVKKDPVMDRLDKLIGLVQRNNILRDGRGSEPTETVDDILAAMITPAKGG